jgi:hypothetical protein
MAGIMKYDKWLHGVVSFMLTIIILGVSQLFHIWWLAPVFVILIGIGKEIKDWLSYGKTMGWKKFWPLAKGDLIADIVGIAIATILFLLLQLF